MTTTCRARGCGKAVGPPYAFCKRHWLALPKPLRRELWPLLTGAAGQGRECGLLLDEAIAAIERAELGGRLL